MIVGYLKYMFSKILPITVNHARCDGGRQLRIILCSARFYRAIAAMHYSALQSAILRLHVVCPPVCNVDGSVAHRLEILETNCRDY